MWTSKKPEDRCSGSGWVFRAWHLMEGVLSGHGRTGMVTEVGKVWGLWSWEVQWSCSWVGAFPRMMTGILPEKILRQVLGDWVHGQKDSAEQAWGRELVESWSGARCGPAGRSLSCSPKTRSLSPKRSLPSWLWGFAVQNWQKECSRKGEGMLCRRFLAKGQDHGVHVSG